MTTQQDIAKIALIYQQALNAVGMATNDPHIQSLILEAFTEAEALLNTGNKLTVIQGGKR